MSPNPHFKFVERAPYELGHLLKKLPEHFFSLATATQDQALIAEAAVQHATHAISVLNKGFEALGHTMFLATSNQEYEMDPDTLTGMCALISHMAVEAQFLQETKDNLQFYMHERALGLSNNVEIKKTGKA
ncbi:MAG: hypothetical protein WBD81_05500 [Collimonas pratensis]|uniref:hypothetical protein n=1 Tax=Collimonas pratensis TaxID=279113 RepID=UPI003C735DE6